MSESPCVGASEVQPLGVTIARFKLNSCEAQDFITYLDAPKNGAGIGAGILSEWWQFGTFGAGVSAVSWYNQEILRDCARPTAG